MEHGEAVVGEDVADVTVEHAARLAEEQREVVAELVTVAMQQHGDDRRCGEDEEQQDPAQHAGTAGRH